jgi:type IV pilus assembly protein PilM
VLGALLARARARRGPRAFGLDIGSAAVKVVELRGTPPSHAIARCARVPLAPGIVAEGTIRDPAAAATAIREAVTAAGIRGSAAVIGICGRELIIRKLQIPEIPLGELADAIRIEAEGAIPFAVDEVFIDYQVTAVQNRLIELTLVAAKKSKVLEYHAAATAAGLVPVVVDVDGFALGNQHELTAEDAAARVALVDVGATMTKLAVVGAGLTHFARDIPLGGDRFTQAVAARLGVAVDAAEAIKTGAARSPDTAAVAQVCESVARDLARELRRALDYHAESDLAAPSVTRVALLGGGAALPGLGASLASIVGVPVAVAQPFQGLAVDPACADAAAQAGPCLALALGLSLRARGDRTTP